MGCAFFNDVLSTATRNTNNYLVGLGVHLFSAPCRSPLEHGTVDSASWVGVLNGNFAGCGAVGVDTSGSRLADADTVGNFFTGNPNVEKANLGEVMYNALRSSGE